ncbi:MAG TPA: lipopolysaccharide heptosyltransferase II [Candidatus Polarisedimenticolaceae bacterium]
MRRTLVVQTAFLGDVVLTTPLLRALHGTGAEVSVVATPLGCAVLDGAPFVARLRSYDKKKGEKGLAGTLRLGFALRRERFDVAIAAQRSFRSGVLVRLSGARERVGFDGAAGRWAYTRKVAWNADRHAVHRYLALFDGPADPTPELAIDPGAAARVEALLLEHGVAPADGVLAVAPGSVWGTKRWTPEGFRAVIEAAPARGLKPVLVGSPEERPLCDAIGGAPVLAGTTGVAELTALLARSRALVTNDSGPGHVASAVGTPVVAVFGPTVPSFGYTPFGERNRIVELAGLDCRPCDRHGPQVCPLGHHRCMKDLHPSRVLAALDEVLA